MLDTMVILLYSVLATMFRYKIMYFILMPIWTKINVLTLVFNFRST